MTTVEKNKSTATELYQQAIAELDNGNLPQASKILWEATVQAFESAAVTRGWQHDSESYCFINVRKLIDETSDQDIERFFGAAVCLRDNFYEYWMRESEVRAKADAVRQLIEHLSIIE